MPGKSVDRTDYVLGLAKQATERLAISTEKAVLVRNYTVVRLSFRQIPCGARGLEGTDLFVAGR